MAKCNCVVFQALVSFPTSQCPSADAIEQHFQQFGKVVLVRCDTLSPTGCIAFENEEEAQSALSVNETIVNGCRLRLFPAERDLSIKL